MNLSPIHPALVHLPLAFVLLSVVADLFARITGKDSLRAVGFWSLLAALIGGVLTVAAGYFDMNHASLSGDTHEYVDLHLKIGWILAIGLTLLTLWRWLIWQRGSPRIGGAYLFVGFLVLALTLFQGWFGGEMVYSYGAGVAAAGQGTEPAPQAQRRLAKVKEFLSPSEAGMGAPGAGSEREHGQGQKSTNQ
jgi:uncharacterized membrane protein